MSAHLETETVPGPAAASSVQPAPTLAQLAPLFPQLELTECLGRGGMGVVYKARQKSLDRWVAIKLLAPDCSSEGAFEARFEKEAQALARLNHPSIVTIHDFGFVEDGDTRRYYLIMEFVDGVNLRQAMEAGRFTPEQALAIVPPICEALQYAHEQGVVHRDIKPENLLLDKEGRVKIADFGIAKMVAHPSESSDTADAGSGTESVATMAGGTPRYMAPEQATDPSHVDHRADIYSLGAVLYELLTGEPPKGQLEPPSRRVEIDVRLDEVVLRALERTPERRYQTAGEFRTRLEEVKTKGRQAQSATSRRGWMRFIVAVAGLMVSIAAALFFTWIASRGHDVPLGSGVPGAVSASDEIVTPAGAFPGIAVGVVVIGFVMLVLSLPLIFRKVPMNALYGMRMRASFASEESWYDINAYGCRQFAKSSIVVIVTGFIGLMVPLHRETAFAFWAVGIVLAAVLVPAIQLAFWSRRRTSPASKTHKAFRSLIVAVPITLFLRVFVVEPFVAHGHAAAPEIPAGSHVLAWKLQSQFRPGDLVIYRDAEVAYRTGRVRKANGREILVERAANTPLVKVKPSAIHGRVISVLWRSSAASSFEEPAGSVSAVRDASLGNLEADMIVTLSPGNVMLGELAFVDEKHAVATTYPAAVFWMVGSPSKTTGQKLRLELREAEADGEWILEISGPFRQHLRIPRQPRPTVYGSPEDPTGVPPLNLAPGSVWTQSHSERTHYFGAGEWSLNTWNEFPVFEVREPDGTRRGELRWRLLVMHADDPSALPGGEGMIRGGNWSQSSELREMKVLRSGTLHELNALPRGGLAD